MAPGRSSVDGFVLTSESHEIIDPRIEDARKPVDVEKAVFSTRKSQESERSTQGESEKTETGPIYVCMFSLVVCYCFYAMPTGRIRRGRPTKSYE